MITRRGFIGAVAAAMAAAYLPIHHRESWTVFDLETGDFYDVAGQRIFPVYDRHGLATRRWVCFRREGAKWQAYETDEAPFVGSYVNRSIFKPSFRYSI